MDNCIFCQIVKQKAPAHKIWEDENHLAFLTIFPNTKGATVVIPKKHQGSYAFEQDDQVLQNLIVATKKVAKLLDNYFDDSSRCGMVFEGWGVDHLHAKLYPMHGTGNIKEWKMIESQDKDQYFEQYPGYICSNDSHRADDIELAKLAEDIKKNSPLN